jgi:CRP-like cAMP-binding protein
MKLPDLSQLDQLFREFCSKEWRDFARKNTVTLCFKPGETIFKEGQKMESMYMIEKGRVKVFSNYTKEIEVVIRFATNGQTLGHRGLGDDGIFPVSAEALSETSVNILPLKIFEDLLRNNNEFCYYFMMFVAEELRRTERQQKNLLNMTVKQRVAKAIKMNAEVFGFAKEDPQLLSFTITRKDISSLANTTYESTVRSLSELQSDKVIKIVGKKLKVTNLEKLCEITSC